MSLAIVLLVAASLHFVLIGDHAQESPVLAFGFLLAAVVQLIQAGLITVAPSRPLLRSVVVLNVLLIGLYLGHILIGLPLPNGSGLTLSLGPREQVDAYGLMTITAEAIAVALAYRLILQGFRPSSGKASQQLPP